MVKQSRKKYSTNFKDIKTSLCKGLLGLVIGAWGGFCIDGLAYKYQSNKVIKSSKAPIPLSDPEVQKFFQDYKYFCYTELGGLVGLALGACSVFGGGRKKKHVPGEGEYEYPYY